MKRRTALGIIGAFPIIGPATAALAQSPVYEVACISWCYRDDASILWGTANCIGEADALKFINECHDKWAKREIELEGFHKIHPLKQWESLTERRYPWHESTIPPLWDGTLYNHFQAAVKKL